MVVQRGSVTYRGLYNNVYNINIGHPIGGGGASSRSSVRGLGRMDFNQGTSFTLTAHNSYTFNQDGYVIIVELTNSSTSDTSYLSINKKTIVPCTSPESISCCFRFVLMILYQRVVIILLDLTVCLYQKNKIK